MNVALRRPLTIDAFIAWEDRQELRYEQAAEKDGQWVAEAVTGANAILALPEIGIEIPLAELYADVGLTGERDPGQPP